MKPWQKTAALSVAGAGLVLVAVWLIAVHHPPPSGQPITGQAPGATNAARADRPAEPGRAAITRQTRGATDAAAAVVRPGPKTGPASNAPLAALRPGMRSGLATNRPAAMPRPGPRTNPIPAAARAAVKPGPATNAASATAGKAAPTGSTITETLRRWHASSSFYPVLSAIAFGLVLAGLLIARLVKSRKAGPALTAAAPASLAARMAKRKTSTAAVHSCNVLQVGGAERRLWHFTARNDRFVLNREQASLPDEPLPAGLVAKDWRVLFQRKLNIAWLPPEQVFLRVAQFPLSSYEETVAMVELQLEKLSPMPVAQIVWSLCLLPQPRDGQQTIIVLIVARNVVEEFLGQLEGQGFLADRLEAPALDQLQATAITGDGTWIYPSTAGGRNSALAAWWYGGALRNLDLLALPPTNRPESLKEQLMQTAWTGEMEGWLTATPRWHLVADAAAAADWEPALRAGMEQPIAVLEPLPSPQLAALTATRATHAEPQANLLPLEFATRYQQQFVDRLWMGGLVGLVGLYLLGVAVYLVALEFALIRTRSVETRVAELGLAYTNAVQIRDRFDVLKDRQELKYAALDCWKALAELLPDSVTLEGYSFSDGKRVNLTGTAPADQQQQLLQFEGNMRKYTKDGQLLFDPLKGESLSSHANPGSQSVTWTVAFELKRVETQ